MNEREIASATDCLARAPTLVEGDELLLALVLVERQEVLAQEAEGLVLPVVSPGCEVLPATAAVAVARGRHRGSSLRGEGEARVRGRGSRVCVCV